MNALLTALVDGCLSVATILVGIAIVFVGVRSSSHPRIPLQGVPETLVGLAAVALGIVMLMYTFWAYRWTKR